jgi:glycine/D-amino acid oxidase-like deaminating enzyme
MGTAPDVVVIGAGIAGTATALALRRAGMAVTLLDTHHPAWGASGRNPGFLWLQTKAAGTSMHFSLACRAFAETFAAGLPDFGFRACGGLILCRDDAYEPVARAFVADRNAAGLPVELLDRTALIEICPDIGPEVSGAVWNPLDAYQDTRRLVGLLATAFEQEGGRIVAPARVEAVEASPSSVTGVRLADGARIACRNAVVAAGPWTNDILASLGMSLPLTSIRFEAAQTAPAPFRLGPVVAGQALFRFFTPPGKDLAGLPRDPTEALSPGLGFTEQIASQPDGTLQFGCAYEAGSGSDAPTVAGQAMACAILGRNFPAIARLPLVRQWAGVVAQVPDGLPVIDGSAGPDGLVLNTGHFFGNLAGAFSGQLIAQMLTGQAPSYSLDAFAAGRFGPVSS